jgi:2-amino-4-hydroxy-6-hydroxymethyldihydropteridine diphosphokinase
VDHIRRVVFGLGSNLGDRVAHIDGAVELLRADADLHVMGISSLYETEAEAGPEHPKFINGAVLVLTSAEALDLLAKIRRVEDALGRVRGERHAPRTIDLDLLWIEGEAVREPGLTVPHPRLPNRAFALRPLLDLAPDARDAETGVVFADLPLARTKLTVVRAGG